MEFSMAGVAAGLAEATIAAVVQIAILGTALIVPAVALAKIENSSRSMLTRSFGWKSVLWTGWLGVPIHEISHWLLCKIFRHEVTSMSLFSPDPRTGTLGFVNHSWDTGSLYQRSGLVLIGIAPVLGGAVLMFAITWFVHPAPILLLDGSRAVAEAMIEPSLATLGQLASYYLWKLPEALLSTDVFLSWRTWLAAYVLMSIGLHMNPSREDLVGAWKAAVLVPLAILVLNVVSHPFGGIPVSWLEAVSWVIAPVVSALLLALALNLVALAFIKGITLLHARVARHRR